MKIDIEAFLAQHKVLPLSGDGWKTCTVRHYTDLVEAQRCDLLAVAQLQVGKKVGGVYIYRDGTGECIYVGKSQDLASRFRTHFQRAHKRDSGDKRDKHFNFWSSRPGELRVSYFVIEEEIDRTLIEAMLIYVLKPAFGEIPRTRRPG